MSEFGEQRDLAAFIRMIAGRAAQREIADLLAGTVRSYPVNIGGPMGLNPTTAVCLLCLKWLREGDQARLWYSAHDGKMRLGHAACVNEQVLRRALVAVA